MSESVLPISHLEILFFLLFFFVFLSLDPFLPYVRVHSSHISPLNSSFQLYVLRDREFVKGLLTRARAAGFTTLVLTADLTWFGKRERDLRNGFTVPPSYSLQQVRTHKNGSLPNIFSSAPAIPGRE